MSRKLKIEIEAVIYSDIAAASLARPLNTADLMRIVAQSYETFPHTEFGVEVVFSAGLPRVCVTLAPHWMA